MERELEVARDLALAAGKVVLDRRDGDLAVETKAGGEPVTRADRDASDLIVAGLARAFPDDLAISEEAPPDLARLATAERAWFVDPVDGTRDFIRGDVGFAVMIGLTVGGRPRLGVVYQPIGENLFLASPEVGCLLTEGTGTRRLRVSGLRDASLIRLVASKSHRTSKIDEVKAVLGVEDELNLGSVGLKLGLIALGERDLYVNPSSHSKAWDTCAPEAILAHAGGRLTDLHGRPLEYRGPDLWNHRGLLASNGILHDEVLAKIRPIFPER